NVREQANTSSKVVTKVSPGQRFIVKERSGSSWVKIDAGENGQGWISTQYAKKV
ncbi:SH3 domain-containing protein, partial [Candidatus Dojkabacteria bacterium]|nr:SH3 domain-containing protein [Candidatus Dojkabacteria bacterium]